MRMLLKKALIVTSGNDTKEVDILLENGKITQISPEVQQGDATIIDCQGFLAIPGLIDPHVHMREPGFVYKEGFARGSMSALAGGVTTFLDMPNTNPPTNSKKRLDDKIALAGKKSLVNFGFHFGTSAKLPKLPQNIASTKIFFDATTGSLQQTDEKILDYYFKNSPIICVHAEEKSVDLALNFHNKYNKLYICHISSKYEMEKALEAKKMDRNVFIEATPHHLFFSKQNQTPKLYMKPPLGTTQDRDFLRKSLHFIDAIGSDHAPHTDAEKLSGKAFGVPGTQTILASMLKLWRQKIITLEQLQNLTSGNAAKIFGIKNKGKISPSYDADIVMIDLHKMEKITDSQILSKAAWTPFSGFEVKGSVKMVILAGKVACRDGKIVSNDKGKEINFETRNC